MYFNLRREVIIATGTCGRPINVCICIIVAALRKCKYAGASAKVKHLADILLVSLF